MPNVRIFSHRVAPIIIGLLTSGFVAWVGAGRNFEPRISDERAYLLQAEIFASGRWKLPARPLPEFFEQEHTFVTPFVAAKYPPGHSLALVPGEWIGWPPLIPLLLAGLSGALIFSITRTISNDGVAFLTWAVWITMPPNWYFLPGYFSETTTLALWMLGWFALLRRHRDGGGHWTVLSVACIAWMLITRPLTGFAYALPTGFLLLREEYRHSSIRYLAYGLLAATLIGAIVPVWNEETLGSWTTTPYQYYSRVYTPFDAPGFGFDSTPPLRPLPADLANNWAKLAPLHGQHTIGQLPRIAEERFVWLLKGLWPDRRIILVGFFIIGLFFLPSAAVIVPVAIVSLLLAYLSFPHPRDWLAYYVEIFPAFALIAAFGFHGTVRAIAKRPWPRPGFSLAAMTLSGVLILIYGTHSARHYRNQLDWQPDALRKSISEISTDHNIVFVRYPANTGHSFLTVSNDAFLQRERSIVVFDRGAIENARLASLFPDRVAYVLTVRDRENASLSRWSDSVTSVGRRN